MKKKICFLLALLIGFVPVLGNKENINSELVYAENKNNNVEFKDFIRFVDSNVEFKENLGYELINREEVKAYISKNIEDIKNFLDVETESEAFQKLESRFQKLNKLYKDKEILITKNKEIHVNSTVLLRLSQDDFGKLTTHWWGTRRTFISDSQAYRFSRKLAGDVAAVELVASIFGVSVAPEAVIGLLTTMYLTDLSNAVGKWANTHPDGFLLDIS